MSKNRRRSERIPFSASANIVSEGKSYSGSIQNMSEEGVGYLLTKLPEMTNDFVPQKNIDLVIQDPSGKKYKLNCEVKWYLRGKGRDHSLTLGMQVIDPPPKYKELIASISNRKNSRSA